MKITVKGIAQVSCKIDTIDFQLSFMTYGKDAESLLDREKREKEKMLASLQAVKKDISLILLSSDIRKEYKTEKNKTVFHGYRMEEQFTFSVKYDVSLLFSFLSLIYKSEDSELSLSYSFSSSLEKENKDKAIQKALKDARRKAEVIAEAMNYKLIATLDVKLEEESDAPYLCASMSEVTVEDSKAKATVEVIFEAE